MIPATVIVGISIGGVRTAQALRSAGYEGHITFVGDEAVPPYEPAAAIAGTSVSSCRRNYRLDDAQRLWDDARQLLKG